MARGEWDVAAGLLLARYIESGDVEDLTRLGMLYRDHLGGRAEALGAFATVLRAKPDHEEARRARDAMLAAPVTARRADEPDPTVDYDAFIRWIDDVDQDREGRGETSELYPARVRLGLERIARYGGPRVGQVTTAQAEDRLRYLLGFWYDRMGHRRTSQVFYETASLSPDTLGRLRRKLGWV